MFSRKYNRYTSWNGEWVFVMIPRKTTKSGIDFRKALLFWVNKRDILCFLLLKPSWKIPLLSDKWGPYKQIYQKLGIKHLMVNHKENFVDPKFAKVKIGKKSIMLKCILMELI